MENVVSKGFVHWKLKLKSISSNIFQSSPAIGIIESNDKNLKNIAIQDKEKELNVLLPIMQETVDYMLVDMV